jgi:sporulation protein YlmC with PRC-barrel domain
MSNLPEGLETKPVFDWDSQPLGEVLGSEVDPKTRDPTSLIIGLSKDARERLDTEKETLSLPFDYVFGIRRDEVRLNRGVSELLNAVEQASETTEAEASEQRVVEFKA